jgi:hypothetical protein
MPVTDAIARFAGEIPESLLHLVTLLVMMPGVCIVGLWKDIDLSGCISTGSLIYLTVVPGNFSMWHQSFVLKQKCENA